MEYITMCLDSTNKFRTPVRQAQQRLLFTSVGYMFQPIHRLSSGPPVHVTP